MRARSNDEGQARILVCSKKRKMEPTKNTKKQKKAWADTIVAKKVHCYGVEKKHCRGIGQS